MPDGLDNLEIVAANNLPLGNGSSDASAAGGSLPSYFRFDTDSPRQASYLPHLLCYGILFKVKTADDHLLSVDLDPAFTSYQARAHPSAGMVSSRCPVQRRSFLSLTLI